MNIEELFQHLWNGRAVRLVYHSADTEAPKKYWDISLGRGEGPPSGGSAFTTGVYTRWGKYYIAPSIDSDEFSSAPEYANPTQALHIAQSKIRDKLRKGYVIHSVSNMAATVSPASMNYIKEHIVQTGFSYSNLGTFIRDNPHVLAGATVHLASPELAPIIEKMAEVEKVPKAWDFL